MGYAATGDPIFLEEYDSARRQLPSALARLRQFVLGEPTQLALAIDAEYLVGNELGQLAALRAQASAEAGRNEAALIAPALRTKHTMEGIEGDVGTIIETETRSDQVRLARSHHLAKLASVTTLLAGLLGAAAGIGAALAQAAAEQELRDRERRTAGDRLEASEERRRHTDLVVSLAGQGIKTLDAQGVCTAVNPAGARMLGYEAHELIGADLHSLVHHHRADGSLYPVEECLIALAARAGGRSNFDEVFSRRDGTSFPVELSSFPLADGGVLQGTVVTFVDTSVRRGLDADTQTRVDELRAAIANEELVVYYQPQIDLATGSLSGAEALVRWAHPTRGLVFPDDFIPLAEQHGLIAPLTRFVLETVGSQQVVWRRLGLEVPVAVNVSAGVLVNGFPEELAALQVRHAIPSGALELEITETAVMADAVTVTRVLNAVVRTGVEIALDDFGTGFSSLAHLRSLPISISRSTSRSS